MYKEPQPTLARVLKHANAPYDGTAKDAFCSHIVQTFIHDKANAPPCLPLSFEFCLIRKDDYQ